MGALIIFGAPVRISHRTHSQNIKIFPKSKVIHRQNVGVRLHNNKCQRSLTLRDVMDRHYRAVMGKNGGYE